MEQKFNVFIWYYYNISLFLVSLLYFKPNDTRWKNIFKFYRALRHSALVSQMDWRHFFASFMFDCLIFFHSRWFYQNLNINWGAHEARTHTPAKRAHSKSDVRNKSFCLQIICQAQHTRHCSVSDCTRWRHLDRFHRLFSAFLHNIDSRIRVH